VAAAFTLEDLRDTAAATERVRRLLDADCDPVAVADAFAGDPVIGPLVRALPGLRVPGHVDGNEVAVRAVLGQQVSVAGARTVAARLTLAHGRPLARPADGLTHLFPDVAALAGLDPEDLPMPRSRGRALIALCAALAHGDLALDRGPDRDDVRRRLLAIPGIGPWTADYVALRALGHPDVFLPTDVGIRDALTGLGQDPTRAVALAEGWRPWRSYAQLYLWQTLTPSGLPHRTEEN
jgi:AraC family transcriptional regulator of adaptative response / DNA-3-methyladenine glycosylase II